MYASEEMIPVFSSSSVDPPSQQQQEEQLAAYRHIHQNEFFQRKWVNFQIIHLFSPMILNYQINLINASKFCRHKKQKDEDIAVCVCKYDASNPESACGERCLNLLTSTECTPGFCPCGVFCKNQVCLLCLYLCMDWLLLCNYYE